jgi:hypothetical protein
MDLPDWLRPAVEAVLRDMQHPSPLLLEAYYARERRPDCWGTLHFKDPGGDQCEIEVPRVPEEGSETDVLLTIATELPFYIAELSQAWGQSRPICPGHLHPAAPTEHEGAAWWCCPRDGSFLAPIGRLPSK